MVDVNRLLLGLLFLAASFTTPVSAVAVTAASVVKVVMGIIGLLFVSAPLFDGTFTKRD